MNHYDAIQLALATLAGTVLGAAIYPPLFIVGAAVGLYLGVELVAWNRDRMPDA